MPHVYYDVGLKHNFMSRGQLLQKWYIIYMEDNHCVILDRCRSNQLIAKIQMKSNILFPFTLKPSMKKNTTQVVYDTKDETAFKEQSEEEVTAHIFKKKQYSGA